MALLLALCVAAATPAAGQSSRGELRLRVVDAETKQPIAARMHLLDSRNRSVQPPGTVFWRDHFCIDGELTLKVRPGTYRFEMERGPEYTTMSGHFQIDRTSSGEQTIELPRYVDMSKSGWWSGELHVHRDPEQIELLMRADDLHVAPVITWWNANGNNRSSPRRSAEVVRFDGDRFYRAMAGEDERAGGALLYFNLDQPLDLSTAGRNYPSALHFLQLARQQADVHVDVEKPFWWDVPVWLASGQVDSIGLVNNHMWRSEMLDNEAWGRPRDKEAYPSPHGNGRWSQDIYYHVLDCGLRIPPSAGSASGVHPNPVGYNRVYVYCGEQLDYQQWWEGLRAGRVVVTNGPLLVPQVEGHPPGHVFQARSGEQLELQVGLSLHTREKIAYLEIVKNGRVAAEVRLDQFAASGGRLPPVTFDESGWFLVRAVTENEKTYRLASTGPYYVEFDGKPRVSRTSAQFFVDWIDQRIASIELDELDDPAQKEALVAEQRRAREFWQQLASTANAQ
ncbi:MAG: CehA/McbA family metallohydrolase [Pirellulales bacterium]